MHSFLPAKNCTWHKCRNTQRAKCKCVDVHEMDQGSCGRFKSDISTDLYIVWSYHEWEKNPSFQKPPALFKRKEAIEWLRTNWSRNGLRLSCRLTWLLSHSVKLTVDISKQLNISMGSPGGGMDGDGAREGEKKGEMRERKQNQRSKNSGRNMRLQREKQGRKRNKKKTILLLQCWVNWIVFPIFVQMIQRQ